MPKALCRAYGIVKKAAAIIQAADEVISVVAGDRL